jgi:hypothetical protein
LPHTDDLRARWISGLRRASQNQLAEGTCITALENRWWQTPREKSWGDRVFGGVRIFVDDSHFESDPFAGKKMSGPIREAVERLYRPLICCDVTSALIRHQRVVLLGSYVNERRAFADTRRVYCARPGARAAGTTAGDTGHVTSDDDTVRDRQRLRSATWGFSRGLGRRWLK